MKAPEGLLERLVAEIQAPPLEDDDVTQKRFADASGYSAYHASKHLEGMVERGELVVVLKRNPETNRPVKAYIEPPPGE